MTEPSVGPVDLLVVGAHPLDAEILGGAIAARLAARGGRSVLVHLTDGAGNYPALGPAGSSRQARSEAEQAAGILDSEIRWLGFPSKQLRAGGRFRAELARLVEAWQPRAVITHWKGSWHERHRVAHRLVLAAVTGVRTQVYYGENFEDLDGFLPTQYVDISDVCGTWWLALEAYQLYRDSRQLASPDHASFPYFAYYQAAPRVRGLECDLTLAQGLAMRGCRTRRKTVLDLPSEQAPTERADVGPEYSHPRGHI
jgi:LmbE family N-acetylglucosaminyl deacetylase